MSSVTRLLTTKLKLRVNREKSAVARPWERKFLGFSFANHKQPKRRSAPKAVTGFKERVRELTRRTRGISLVQMVHELAEYLGGWIGYFRRCQCLELARGSLRRTPRKPLALRWWHLANTPALNLALSNAYFASLGLPELTPHGSFNPPNRRMRTRMSGRVGGEACSDCP